jgi:hypothetical protein
MKYNYIISIFLLLLVIIISQSIHVHINRKKTIEGWWRWRWTWPWYRNDSIREAIRRAAEAARRAAEAARARYLAFVGKFVNDRQTPYVNLLGRAYVNSVNPSGLVGVPYLNNSETQTNLTAYNEAVQIDSLTSQTNPCNSDDDIAKIILLTSNILSGNGKNSTKVYFISEVIFKALGHFYVYNIKNNETQFNYLNVQFPTTFKDDNDIKKKYYKFISLLSLAHISKSTTSSSLSPGSNYFLTMSAPIIQETKKIIDDLKNIKYDLSDEEKQEIQNKYTTIVH